MPVTFVTKNTKKKKIIKNRHFRQKTGKNRNRPKTPKS
jgi:hypothetical protein